MPRRTLAESRALCSESVELLAVDLPSAPLGLLGDGAAAGAGAGAGAGAAEAEAEVPERTLQHADSPGNRRVPPRCAATNSSSAAITAAATSALGSARTSANALGGAAGWGPRATDLAWAM